MSTVMVELDSDAFLKLEAAKFSPQEKLSEVVRRAQFPRRPRIAADLLEAFKQRAGGSPLSEEALDQLDAAQRNPSSSPSHWAD